MEWTVPGMASSCCKITTLESKLDDARSTALDQGASESDWWTETNVGCGACMYGWTWCPCPIPCPCCGFCTVESEKKYERFGFFGVPFIFFRSYGDKQDDGAVLWENHWGGLLGIKGAWKGRALYMERT